MLNIRNQPDMQTNLFASQVNVLRLNLERESACMFVRESAFSHMRLFCFPNCGLEVPMKREKIGTER